MKRLFVSLMVIGGSILFGMQAAESAPMGSKADRARKRCSKIKSLGARAACCAKIRPASRLSPKRKLCRPVSARARREARGRESRTRFCGRIISNRSGETAHLRSRCIRRMGRCDKIQNPEKRAKCRARVKARIVREIERDGAYSLSRPPTG